MPQCDASTTNCGGVGVNTSSDPANCGACARNCPVGQICAAGQCDVVCAAGTTNCGNVCVDTNSDSNNCGGCAIACNSGKVCGAGQCALQFGPAQWVKVYKNEQNVDVTLDQLTTGNPIVPQDPTQIETEWRLLQFNPNHAGGDKLQSQAQMQSGSRSVVRRWEHFKYAGAYDSVTHEALCADPTCSAPGPNEIGAYIGAQMAAAVVGIPGVNVTKAGAGTVTGVAGKINCGGTCSALVSLGTSVSLTASAPSNGVFTGWSGDCSGTQNPCVLTVSDQLNVTANFTPIFGLSIGRSGSGSVVGNPSGVLATSINCGGNCSAKFMQNQVVTLTATPAAGLSFVNWTNGCSGNSPTTSVTITQNTTCQANFK